MGQVDEASIHADVVRIIDNGSYEGECDRDSTFTSEEFQGLTNVMMFPSSSDIKGEG